MALNKGKSGKGKGDEEELDEDVFMPLDEIFKKLKQGPLNFGVYQTGDKEKPVLFAAHKRKNAEMLGKKAKKQAGTSKGSFGAVSLDSGILSFECQSDKVPRSLTKKIRLLLKAEGYTKFKARVLLPGGEELGEHDDDDEEGEEEAVNEVLEDGGSGSAPPEAAEDASEEEKEKVKEEREKAARDKILARCDELEKEIDGIEDEQLAETLRSELEETRRVAEEESIEDAMRVLKMLERDVKQATGGKGDKEDDLEAKWEEMKGELEALVEAADPKIGGQAKK